MPAFKKVAPGKSAAELEGSAQLPDKTVPGSSDKGQLPFDDKADKVDK